MYEVSSRFSVSSAHFLRGYEGKCRNVHGHNWKIAVYVGGEKLLPNGMLLDFGDLKKILRAIEDEIDHKCINDVAEFQSLNPTAENIAEFVCKRTQEALKSSGRGDLRVTRVSVFETENCEAVFTPGESGPAGS